MRMPYLPPLIIAVLACTPQSGTGPTARPADSVVEPLDYGCRSLLGADSQDPKLYLPAKVLRASAVKTIEPLYPPLAKTAGVHGQVLIEVIVDEAGTVLSANAISGHPLLRNAAETAATGWTFRPAINCDRPVRVTGILAFKFQATEAEIEELIARLRNDPSSTYCYDELAKAYVSQERYQEAIAVYKRAIRLDRDAGDHHYGLGLVYLEMGKYQKAADELHAAAQLEPLLSIASWDLGKAEEKLGHYDLAIQAYKDSIRAREEPEVMCDLGKLYNKLARYKDAIELLQKAAEIDDTWEELQFELGFAYAKTGDREKATLQYDKLKSLQSPLADELLDSMRRHQK